MNNKSLEHTGGVGQILIRWTPAIIMMLVIFLISAIPSSELPKLKILDLVVKKGGHMMGYGFLALSFLRLFPSVSNRSILLALFITIIYAATDEWHQTIVPGRNGTLWDVGVDALGAGISLWLVQRWSWLRHIVYSGIISRMIFVRDTDRK